MIEIALEITLCLIIAALIGFILGFIVAKATAKKNVQQKETTQTSETLTTLTEEENLEQKRETRIKIIPEETPVEVEEIETPTSPATQNAVEALKALDKTTPREGQKPEILDAPKSNQKDALTKIKGIGPKIEEQLNAAGIYHFEQIANWSKTNIQWLEKNTTFAHRAKKDLWINQAKSLI